MVLSLVFVAGCEQEDKVPPDPEGTIMFTMRNNGILINSYNNEQRGTGIGFVAGTGCWVAMTSANNFLCQFCSIASVGKVAGLGNITKIPTNGFVGSTSVAIGYGYVIKLDDGTYARLYVIDWTISSTTDGITGAKVKYQYPWNP